MTMTYLEANDAMYGAITNLWDTHTQTVLGLIPNLQYPGIKKEQPLVGNVFNGKTYITTLDTRQTTLSAAVTGEGKSRYTDYGYLSLEIYIPQSQSQSFLLGKTIAEKIRDALHGRINDSIVLKNSTIKERNPAELFSRLDVVVEYEYDGIR